MKRDITITNLINNNKYVHVGLLICDKFNDWS